MHAAHQRRAARRRAYNQHRTGPGNQGLHVSELKSFIFRDRFRIVTTTTSSGETLDVIAGYRKEAPSCPFTECTHDE